MIWCRHHFFNLDFFFLEAWGLHEIFYPCNTLFIGSLERELTFVGRGRVHSFFVIIFA